MAGEKLWYKNVIVYTIDVKSFCDSNNDGIGDFKGLTSKLDYISDLGITCIWLLPFYPSPLKDNGYDIVDYYTVDPKLGTLEDFMLFTQTASERGIKVIVDLVINHTSDEHPWFIASKKNPQSIFRDYYIWTQSPPPSDPNDKPAFPDTEHGVWKFDEVGKGYYYHKFYQFQPDLKIANPRVQDEVNKIMDYWLSIGVSGFRLDAAPVLIKKKGLDSSSPSNSHEVIKNLRKSMIASKSSSILAGEVDVDGPDLIDYFADGNGLHLVYNFLLNAYLIGAIAKESKETLIRGWRELPIIPDNGNWLNFLRNLDELNLHQLPKNDKDKILKLFAPDKNMQIYGRGIRRRLASMLKGNQKRIEMAYSLLFSLPGTPMIVYGDEIGMGENLDLFEREAVRTPMQWNDEAGAGFSNLTGHLYRPLVNNIEFSHSIINVKIQLDNEASLLNQMKKIIAERRAHLEIGNGRLAWVKTSHESVLAHICHWKNDMLLAVHNLGGYDLEVSLDLKTVFAKRLKSVLGNLQPEAKEDDIYDLVIPAYGYGWFSVHYERGE